MKLILELNRWIYLITAIPIILPKGWFQLVLGIVGSILCLLWMYSVNHYGQKQLRHEHLPTRHLKMFTIAFLMIPVLIVLNALIAPKLLDLQNNMGILVFVFLVLLTIFCGLYIYYLTAKTITMLEQKTSVSFKACYNNLLLVGIQGIGIFFLQPKVQQLIEMDESHEP